MRILIGSYDETQGIWELRLDLENMKVLSYSPVANTRRNSYLAIHKNYCYAVSSIPLAEGSNGSLHSFQITAGGLELIDSLHGLPALLPHLQLNRKGTVLYTASYGTGEILAVSLNSDGSFGQIISRTQNSGSSVNSRRQTCAHPHSVWLDTNEQNLYLCDLGTDEVLSWPLAANGAILTEKKQSLKVPLGYGPRHMAFSPDGSYAYVLCEMKYHTLVLKVEGGHLTLLRDISLEGEIPENQQGGAAIRTSPNGAWLFCSNRGVNHSRIDILSLKNPEDPTPVDVLKKCQWPRDFVLTEDGNYLFCGNQTENSISLFARTKTGRYEFRRKVGGIPTPVCLIVLEQK